MLLFSFEHNQDLSWEQQQNQQNPEIEEDDDDDEQQMSILAHKQVEPAKQIFKQHNVIFINFYKLKAF